MFRFPELAEALERFGAEGAEPFYRGEIGGRDRSDFVVERRRHRRARPTSPPTRRSSASRSGPVPRRRGPDQPAAVLGRHPDRLLPRAARAARRDRAARAAGRGDGGRQRRAATRRSPRPSTRRALETGFLDPAGLDLAAADLLGSTTHISVARRRGRCAPASPAPTAPARASGPGHRGDPQQHARRGGPQPARLPPIVAGRRVPSMMAPTVVLRDGEIVLGLGSAGSNRIRSAILQTIVRCRRAGHRPSTRRCRRRACTSRPGPSRPSRGSTSDAGADRGARRTRSSAGAAINLFFGGVQAVAAGHGRPEAAATRAAAAPSAWA